jgi:hypothetical protein
MVMPGKICHVAEVSRTVSMSAADIPDTLPELVKALVAPLFAQFSFFEPPDELYSSELNRMQTGRL